MGQEASNLSETQPPSPSAFSAAPGPFGLGASHLLTSPQPQPANSKNSPVHYDSEEDPSTPHCGAADVSQLFPSFLVPFMHLRLAVGTGLGLIFLAESRRDSSTNGDDLKSSTRPMLETELERSTSTLACLVNELETSICESASSMKPREMELREEGMKVAEQEGGERLRAEEVLEEVRELHNELSQCIEELLLIEIRKKTKIDRRSTHDSPQSSDSATESSVHLPQPEPSALSTASALPLPTDYDYSKSELIETHSYSFPCTCKETRPRGEGVCPSCRAIGTAFIDLSDEIRPENAR